MRYLLLVIVVLVGVGCGGGTPSPAEMTRIAEATRDAYEPDVCERYDCSPPTPEPDYPEPDYCDVHDCPTSEELTQEARENWQYECPAIGTVTASTLNVRSGPDLSYRVIDQVHRGHHICILGVTVDGAWLNVMYWELEVGWVSAAYVSWYSPPSAPQPQRPPPAPSQGYTCNQCIKGNVSYTTGEKIYHLPSCEYYEETVINPDYGERWFSTEAEARAAGWRKAYNCP